MTAQPDSRGDSDAQRAGLPVVETRAPNVAAGPVARINEELRRQPKPTGFLGEAEAQLAAVIDEYTGDLGIAAVRQARGRRATAVDVDDVLTADERLRGSRGALLHSWLLTLAGITGGAAGATGITVGLLPEPPPHVGYWWTAVVTLAVATLVLLLKTSPWRKSG